MKTLKVVDFIKKNEDWRKLLAGEPYFLIIVESDGYILLKYNQLCSDFNNEIVRECRGLILDSDYNPVCVPFFKFGNYGESYCPEIDWKTARVQAKIDGSLHKAFFDRGKWHIATNGTINAYTAHIGEDVRCKELGLETFGDLFDVAAKNSGLDFSRLNKDNTYMFELVSPYSRVVVPYDKTEIYHIGTRNNRTLEEIDEDIGVQKPETFSINTLEDCIAAASALPYDKEGYVVVDGSWNRAKVKSPQYVIAHLARNNNVITEWRLIEIIRKNEIDEFLLYCGDYEEALRKVENKIEGIIHRMEEKAERYMAMNIETHKEFAEVVGNDVDSAWLFRKRRFPETTAREFFWRQTPPTIERMVKNA